MKLLTAVLTSCNLKKLKRALVSIGQLEDVVIICNTLDEEYYKKVCEDSYCQNFNIVRTQSNGTAAKGKQSVIDYFLNTEYDWITMLDGDDFLGPDGISIVHNTLQNSNADVLFTTETIVFPNLQNFHSTKQFHCINWQILSPKFMALANDKVRKQMKTAYKFYSRVKKTLGQKDYTCFRLLCCNKQSAKTIQYPSIICHEDFNVNFKLLEQATIGNLNLLLLVNDSCYIYDRTITLNVGNTDSASATLYDIDITELEKNTYNGITLDTEKIINNYKIPEIITDSVMVPELEQYIKERIL
jgi:hypothetical protein